MTPAEMKEERKWSSEIYNHLPPLIQEPRKKGKKKREPKELSFQEQLDLEAAERDYERAVKAFLKGEAASAPAGFIPVWNNKGFSLRRYEDPEPSTVQEADDEAVGDLAEELGIAFKIVDRIVWFLKELDIEAVTLPDEIEKESLLLFREAKNFVDRMEYGQPLLIQASIDAEEMKK